jgi:soluble lytic murein transglycosylase-like protein
MIPDLSTPVLRLALVTPIALKYGLQPSVVAAVCEQESGWEPGAVRFEPAFLRHYVAPLNLALLESLSRSTSWGLMQIMGQVAREMGFTDALDTLRTPEVGILYGCKKLQRCYLQHRDDTTSLLAYNGGGNSFYAKQVLARVEHYTNV